MPDTDNIEQELREQYPQPSSAATERARAAVMQVANERPRRTFRWPRLVQRRPIMTLVSAALIIAVGAFLLGSAFPLTAKSASGVESPGFLPAPGWTEVSTGTIPMGDGPTAIATNGQLAQEDGPVGTFPTNTLKQLPANGILFYVVLGNRADANSSYTPAQLPLQLSNAHVLRSFEGMPRPNLLLYQLPVEVGNYILEVDVFFGTQHPTPAQAARQFALAQDELNRLQVPSS
jgi:hypothetical protein